MPDRGRWWDDEEWERLLAELREQCDAAMAARAEAILARIDEVPPIPFGSATCVLLGFEGQVDVAWDVLEPRPDTLLRPLPLRPSAHVSEAADPMSSVSIASYQRVGEFTYERVA